jgi:predicted GIY-YIG superfamily endonuclease
MEQIYILKLRAGKYYIGKTRNVEKRYESHLIGEGSGWTKKYRPLSLVKTIKSTSQFDEDKYVKEYMAKYGIENVRGGTYSNVVLDANSIALLEKEIRHSKNLCTRCGRDTHYIKDCYATTDSEGVVIGEIKKEVSKKPNVYKENVKTKTRKKGWGGDDSDSCDSCDSYDSCDDGDSCGGDEGDDGDSEDEAEEIQVLMNMTSGMLKKVRKIYALC